MNQPRDDDGTAAGGPEKPELPDNLKGWVELKDGGKYTLRLSVPVTHGDQTIESIDGRRPRGKAMRKVPLDRVQVGDWLELFQLSSGTVTAVADQLDGADVMRVVTLMGFFMGDGLATGPTSSAP